VLLGDRCGACGRADRSPCPSCIATLRVAPSLAAPAPLTSVAALLEYDGPARDLVAGIKHRHARSAVAWLADGLALLVPEDVTLLTWTPTSPDRTRRRGFDHAAVLARAVGRRAGVRTERLLSRRRGPPQTGRSRLDRLRDPPQFAAVFDLTDHVVVVVDDVTTTGATLLSAARALTEAGAGAVHGLAAAATPPSR
jgi:predicted amidophosphoribosyltransferase